MELNRYLANHFFKRNETTLCGKPFFCLANIHAEHCSQCVVLFFLARKFTNRLEFQEMGNPV